MSTAETVTPQVTPAVIPVVAAPTETPVAAPAAAAAVVQQPPVEVAAGGAPAQSNAIDLLSMVNGISGNLVVNQPPPPVVAATVVTPPNPAVANPTPVVAPAAAAAAVAQPVAGTDGLVYDANGVPSLMPVQQDAGMSFFLKGANMDWADARKWDPETQKKISEYGALNRAIAVEYTKKNEESAIAQKALEETKASQKALHDKLKDPLEDLTKSRQLASKFLTDFAATNNNKELKMPTDVNGTLDLAIKQINSLKRQLIESDNKVLALEGKQLVMQGTNDYTAGTSSSDASNKRHAAQDPNNQNQPVAAAQKPSNFNVPPDLAQFLDRIFMQEPIGLTNRHAPVQPPVSQAVKVGWSKANIAGKNFVTSSSHAVYENMYSHQSRVLQSNQNFNVFDAGKPTPTERMEFNNNISGYI